MGDKCGLTFAEKTKKMYAFYESILDFGYGSFNKGEYAEGVVYNKNDIVTHLGVVYVSIGDNHTDLPPSSKWDKFLNGVKEVDTVEDLDSVSLEKYDTFIVRDTVRGGLFVYDSSLAGVYDGGTVFGGKRRIYQGAVKACWFGAKGDGVTDDSVAIEKASLVGVVELTGGGAYVVSTPPTNGRNLVSFDGSTCSNITVKVDSFSVVSSQLTDISTKQDTDDERISVLEISQVAGKVGFTTKADMDADLAHADGTIASVLLDTTPANNGDYLKSGASGTGSWIASSFDRLSLVESDIKSQKTNDFPNYNCFVKYLSSNLDVTLNENYYSGTPRGSIYRAFRNLSLSGFDSTKIHKLRLVWNDAYALYFRIIFSSFDGVNWVDEYDSGNIYMTDLGYTSDRVEKFKKTVNLKTVEAEIDLKFIPPSFNGILNADAPDMIVASECYNTRSLIPDSLRYVNASKQYIDSRRKPTFAFVFDDLQVTDSLVYSIFEEYGFVPNFALIPSRITTVNISEYQEYYMKGCSILAHAITPMYDPSTITNAEVDAEMTISKTTIEQYGIKVSGWVTPSSSLDISFIPEAIKNFGYAFTGLNQGIYNETVDPVKMHRYGLESNMANHNIAAVKARVDTAITNNELLVFYAHALPSTYLNADGTPYMTETDLRELLAYIKIKADNNLCKVLSCDDAIYQYYKQPIIV